MKNRRMWLDAESPCSKQAPGSREDQGVFQGWLNLPTSFPQSWAMKFITSTAAVLKQASRCVFLYLCTLLLTPEILFQPL